MMGDSDSGTLARSAAEEIRELSAGASLHRHACSRLSERCDRLCGCVEVLTSQKSELLREVLKNAEEVVVQIRDFVKKFSVKDPSERIKLVKNAREDVETFHSFTAELYRVSQDLSLAAQVFNANRAAEDYEDSRSDVAEIRDSLSALLEEVKSNKDLLAEMVEANAIVLELVSEWS